MLRPESGEIIVDGVDVVEATARELNEVRTLFGMMFQDGALFGSMNLYDNTAFPLREHTRKKEREIRNIVMEKLEMVGLAGDEDKFPSEISGRHAQACRVGLSQRVICGSSTKEVTDAGRCAQSAAH